MSNSTRIAYIRQYIQENIALSNAELAEQLHISIGSVKYHVRVLGLQGKRKIGRPRTEMYDEYILQHFPHKSSAIIAEELGISRNGVLKYARRLNVTHDHDFNKHRKPIKENLVGQRFNRLTVMRQLGTNKYGQMRYECVCDCGNTAISTAGNLKHGHMKSCGCSRYKVAK